MQKQKFLLAANAAAIATFVVMSVFHACSAAAQPVPAPLPPPQTVDAVLVTGEQPGPGMWKVTRGNNVLWIVGTQTPLPRNMNWRAKGLADVVARSQEILGEPGIAITLKKIGYFRALTMLPAAMEARKNPGDATLKDVLPAELYRRWEVLRDKYIPESFNPDSDIEQWRPMFAARKLYVNAIERAGLSTSNVVWPVVREAAKTHKVPITEVMLEPDLSDPRKVLNDFRANRLADIECFAKTVERIETDVPDMRLRANAWARGQVEKLRTLPPADQSAACEAAIRDAAFLKTLGVEDLRRRMEEAWLTAADKALARNAVTLAVLPMRQMVMEGGYLAKLKARGYQVTEPDDES